MQSRVVDQTRPCGKKPVRRARDHHAKFSEQPACPVQQCRALFLPACSHTVPSKNRLLLDRLDCNEPWIRQLHEREGYDKTLIAIANKHAQMLWAMLAKGERYAC